MQRYLIERTFGTVTPEEMAAGGSASKRVAAEHFPDLVWEHSHAVRAESGIRSFCIYRSPDEQMIRDHARVAGLPVDRIHLIEATVRPDDLP